MAPESTDPPDHPARFSCPICGESLASARAVLFRDRQPVHARCWPGDEAQTRICAKCERPLDRYEPAAFQGRTADHVRC